MIALHYTDNTIQQAHVILLDNLLAIQYAELVFHDPTKRITSLLSPPCITYPLSSTGSLMVFATIPTTIQYDICSSQLDASRVQFDKALQTIVCSLEMIVLSQDGMIYTVLYETIETMVSTTLYPLITPYIPHYNPIYRYEISS